MTLEMAQSFLKDGLRSPRSTPPIYPRSMFASRAKSSCDRPLAFRACRILRPSSCSELNFRNTSRLKQMVIMRPRIIIYISPCTRHGNVEDAWK